MAADAEVVANEENVPYVSRTRLIELLGADAARRLCAAIGGTRFRVPAPASLGAATLGATIGARAADKFCYQYGGQRVVLPRALFPLREQIVELTHAGMSAVEIARKLGCTERRVWQVRQARSTH